MLANRDNNDRNMAVKLHRQFAHPTPKTLIQLVRNAGIKNSNLVKEINEISEECITCLKKQKRFARPIVCTPLATEFNQNACNGPQVMECIIRCILSSHS